LRVSYCCVLSRLMLSRRVPTSSSSFFDPPRAARAQLDRLEMAVLAASAFSSCAAAAARFSPRPGSV
jgi:hypothetical protein